MQPQANLLEGTAVKLDLIVLFAHASWPVKITLIFLVCASTLVWMIGLLKLLQLSRLRTLERAFEQQAKRVTSARELGNLAGRQSASAGARVVVELGLRGAGVGIDRLRAAADQAIVRERQRATAFMSTLGSIASVSPFVGLFGTVYGIMDAFIRIGAAKSASLPVVAPAIGEALIATAIGLGAAIPAVLFYNFAEKQVADYISELEAATSEWVAILGTRTDTT